MPGTFARSSILAFFISSRVLNSCHSALRRAGPMPSIWSSIDTRLRLPRSLRWYVIAKRWASSRMDWSSCKAGVWWLRIMDSLRPSTKTSSIRFARLMTGAIHPASRMMGRAAWSWPFPPSMMMRSGIGHSFSLYRRFMISAIDLKSSGLPCTVFSLKRRYSFLSGRPSVKTTMDATVSMPCVCEISKHSIRSGNVGKSKIRAKSSTAPVVFSSSCCHWSRRCSRRTFAFSSAIDNSLRLMPRCGTVRMTRLPLRDDNCRSCASFCSTWAATISPGMKDPPT